MNYRESRKFILFIIFLLFLNLIFSNFKKISNIAIKYEDNIAIKYEDYTIDTNGYLLNRKYNEQNVDKLIINLGRFNDTMKVAKNILKDFYSAKRSCKQFPDSFYQVRIYDTAQARKLFDFFSKNSCVEYTFIKFDNKYVTISTSHLNDTDCGCNVIIDEYNVRNKFVKREINEFTHTHPGSTTASSSDTIYKTALNKLYPDSKIIFGIRTKSGRYIYY